MNRVARWMMRLYPALWRKRYGDELDALISDAGADVRTVADLARGGIRMQFSTWSFAKLAVVLGIAGVVLGIAASFLSRPMYESKATVAMEGTPGQMKYLIGWVEPVLLSRIDLSSIINDPRLILYKDQLKVTPLDDVIELMRSNIRIAAGSGQTIEISFRYPDATKAQQTTAILADHLVSASGQERSTRSSEVPHPYMDVIDTANLPLSNPVGKAIERVGFLLGALVPFLGRRILRKRLLSWWLLLFIPVCTVLGGIAGEFVVICQDSGTVHLPGYRFRSTSVMFAGNLTKEQIQEVIDGTLTRASLATVIQDPRLMLYADELQKTPLDDVVQEMQRRVTIAPVPDHPNYITLSYEYKDRFKTQQTVEVLMTRMTERWGWKRNNTATALTSQSNWGPVFMQSPASPPQPIAGDLYQYGRTGGVIGLILAALIALIRRRWTPESAIIQ